MKLRDHPLVRPHWPPSWTPFYGSRTPARDEIGILDDIRLSHVNDMCCFLLIVHEGTNYIGAITFDDDEFCHRFVDVVQPIVETYRSDRGARNFLAPGPAMLLFQVP